mgnify:CR=1 FL=1
MTYSNEQKPCLWSSKYVIENLPPWIYSDSQEPSSLNECTAKISALNYTIKDIDLQIQIRELELKTGSSRHHSNFDFEKWKAQALRAKQTHTYMLNAYTYWLILNEKKLPLEADSSVQLNDLVLMKLRRVIEILIEEPPNFVEELEQLL